MRVVKTPVRAPKRTRLPSASSAPSAEARDRDGADSESAASRGTRVCSSITTTRQTSPLVRAHTTVGDRSRPPHRIAIRHEAARPPRRTHPRIQLYRLNRLCAPHTLVMRLGTRPLRDRDIAERWEPDPCGEQGLSSQSRAGACLEVTRQRGRYSTGDRRCTEFAAAVAVSLPSHCPSRCRREAVAASPGARPKEGRDGRRCRPGPARAHDLPPGLGEGERAMDIGKPKRTYTVEPLSDPLPRETPAQPASPKQPQPQPVREREGVPGR